MNENEETITKPMTGWRQGDLPITITYISNDGHSHQLQFARTFVVGREPDCDVCLDNKSVSRQHLRVFPEAGYWYIQDLGSTNGTCIDDKQVQHQRITSPTRIDLGAGSVEITLEPSTPTEQQARRPQIESNGDASAAGSNDHPEHVSDYTRLIHFAVNQAKLKYNRRYLFAIAGFCVLLLAALTTVYYQQNRLSELKSLTVSVFYDMKEMELQLARIEMQLKDSDDEKIAQLRKMRSQLSAMESRYDTFLKKLGTIRKNLPEDEQLILKMARIFGECEVDMPPGFVAEVRRYIQKWKTTPRFVKAIKRAQENGYSSIVKATMLEQYLPPQFFYLALQESDFKKKRVGPKTRHGIAKGIWQFITATARRYGLKTGPLLEVRKFDPRDERFNFERATRAAAHYLHDIYSTEAQASGLLVIASYNFGENRLNQLIKKMPENPRERNFWALLKKHKIPRETYDYVFYIFSAAVIGENPRLFGFEIDNPLNTDT